MEDFKGKTILVTGGSRGLGEAICRLFARQGARVVINYANGREAAEKIARETNGLPLACDISDEEQTRCMFEEIGGVDILVNNARVDPYARPENAGDGEWWDRVMAVNLKGAYLCGKFALEDMRRKRWGRMVHISSLWAYQPANERMLSYAAAKSAMHALSRGFARMGAPDGITSNVLAPGLILTDLAAVRLTPELMEKEMAGIPLGRGASPEEIAQAVIDLCATPFMTGAVVDLNGGALMRP